MVSTHAEIHTEVMARLRQMHQRYTPQRREIVEVLADVGDPLTIQNIRQHSNGLAQSSVYRNLVVLEEFGIVTKVVTNGDIGRYELAEDLTGHHHHLICSLCGVVRDVVVPEALERDIDCALGALSRRAGFSLDHHRLDVIGRCSTCR
ncbi:MAG: Fur family transcriptional regulator [Ilumatobacteraceae bacterium]